ncbi:hypothetical protein GCM10027055_05990 [Janibacter alkaliphilus]|uniref:Dihydrofolate reductase n=1 Tax=Janibacter alkaliphilus TaxID=1069963 RepID=A0A852X8Y2_9MICO|nr:dihydrofolate reductase family protein [Janibacter alkaliphilus]NYG37213.1 dihydrofolate reductase [Janibacter alkaliphilus]
MGRLVYEMLASLDGYVRDPSGDYQWATPGPALHDWFNEQVATRSAEVYGRGMWEDMRYWLDPPAADLEHPEARGFAQAWQGIDKVVVSTTLTSLDAPRTTLWPALDLDRLAELVRDAPGDVGISGPTLAASALRAGLVDQVCVAVMPHATGGGLPLLPPRLSLDLAPAGHETFDDGSVVLRYDVSRERRRPAG